MTPISSLGNTKIKAIRALRSRKAREGSSLFFVEGIRAVAEAVRTGAEIETLVVAPPLLTSEFARALVAAGGAAGVPCLEVTPAVFHSLSAQDGPPGIAAVVTQRWALLDEQSPADGDCWVALHAVQRPGNLGAVLRTSDAVGAVGLILVGPTTDPYDPVSVRASMGAIFSQRLVRATHAEFVRWVDLHGVAVAGGSPEAAVDYRLARYRPPLVVMMGSEQHGLPPEMRHVCDTLVRIPMAGRADSLNLAVAAGLILYEAFRQQRPAAAAGE